MNYRWMNRGDRIEAPLVRDGRQARRHRLGHRARPARPDAPRRGRARAVILASGRASTESLGPGSTAARPARRSPRAVQVPLGEEAPLPGVPGPGAAPRARAQPARRRAAGLHARLGRRARCAAARRGRRARRRALGAGSGAAAAASRDSWSCSAPSPPTGSATRELVLPVTNMAEENGTYVNRDRACSATIRPSPSPAWRGRPGGSRARCWRGSGPDADAPATAGEAFALLGERWPEFAGLHATPSSGCTGRVLPSRRGGALTAQRARLGDAGAARAFCCSASIKMLVVFTVMMVGVALLTLMERKVCAWMQNRRGPESRRFGRAAAARCRRAQEHPEGRDLSGRSQPAASSFWRRCLSFIPALLPFAVIPFAAPLPVDFDFTLGPLGRFVTTADADGRGRPADRLPLRPRHQLARRVRHRAGRLVVEQQVRPARRAPRQRADDLLRSGDGAEPDPGPAPVRQRELLRDRRVSSRSGSGTCCRCSSRSSSS